MCIGWKIVAMRKPYREIRSAVAETEVCRIGLSGRGLSRVEEFLANALIFRIDIATMTGKHHA